ncbi:dTDP-4-dehydrorhamnose reductase [Effusibacillus consociatus]|uniref:dTDP-4-dehydrorhamnose reductase n=1 Tax=Effusibacillus consociatus TaxID=1117041 RepID=A0ABV9Q7S1_9BACL
MKVLITGAGGQLGSDLSLLLKIDSKRYEVFPFAREELDITNYQHVDQILQEVQPDVVVHTAAYTKVDQAEEDAEAAYLVNAVGTRNVAVASEKVRAKLVYISTDYVFDGKKGSPYTEFDSPNPVNVYGKSKLIGEEFVKAFSSRYFIVRTSWVYGKHGTNFVKTMLKLAQERDELMVVNDQIGSLTYTVDLAHFIKELIGTELYGTYHASNSGTCSWYQFAVAIFEEAGIKINVHPCTTPDFPRPAPRPGYSVLDHMSIRLNGLQDLRHWREGLREFLNSEKTE